MHVAFRQNRALAALAASMCLLLVGVACGRLVVETQTIDAPTVPLLVGAAGALGALALMFLGPMACVAAIAALSMVPLLPTVPILEGVDVHAADAFYLALVVWAALEFAKPGARRATGHGLRTTPILLFLAFTVMSLLYVMVVDSGAVVGSLVSWLRFVQTLSIAVLAALFLKSPRDVRVLLATVALAGIVAVAIGMIGGVGGNELDDAAEGGRAAGAVGPNALGLMSGLLVLMAVVGALGPRVGYRLGLAIVGAAGLVASESVGSLVGTAVAITLALVFARPRRSDIPGLRAMTAVAAVVLAVGLAYAVASVVRPENLPTSQEFKTSSTWHRTVVGAAGVELAARNPILGVGWRRSGLPHVIGDSDVTTDLRTRFAGTRNVFFPDAEPTSVHNAYVQIAAETGLIGLALLVAALVFFSRDVRDVLERVPRGTEPWRQLWYLGWAVVLILVWLNESPLFGGQVETILLTLFIGAIAGRARVIPRPL